tara:strand:+ start:65 stop:592 length:528 start_codon:yes stop_codon:yes gene_type:complete
MDLTNFIRTVPDFPEPGILFRDVTTLFSNPNAFQSMILSFENNWQGKDIEYIAGIDARGFIIGGALAHHMGVGFVPVRKKGKLPYKTIEEDYVLEYGTATLELHVDAIPSGSKVLVVDDLIATGGTAIATINLIKRLEANVVGCSFLVNLPNLKGSGRIKKMGIEVNSLCEFDGE